MITAKQARQKITRITHMPLTTKEFLYQVEARLQLAIKNSMVEFTVMVPPALNQDALEDAKAILEDMGFFVRDRSEEGLLAPGIFKPARQYLILSF
jgi:hypothetical protein